MSWERFKKYYLQIDKLGISLDISRMNFSDDFLGCMDERIEDAVEAMEALEKGAIANPDENRMVGHYWLRDPDRAPTSDIREEIRSALEKIKSFVAQIHAGEISGQTGSFENVLIIGIGGSALGPQFVAQALGEPLNDKIKPYFFDNTDPDGIDRTLDQLKGKLGQTLAVVISKSGGTPETRNGMLEAEQAYRNDGLDFAKHAVAVTGEGSKLGQYAAERNWLTSFPMWDWVGGRTSELAAVGLLPAALQGINIDGMLEGAREMDKFTRSGPANTNPAALLALMWYHATRGKGEKDMVILPYKDRLMLFSKYLQQLIMESLGKEKDLHGQVVNQGIAVYGNKGSTDQHAYVQQLREGVNNFFITFIEVLRDRTGESIEVEPDITSGDYLQGFYLGTRDALYDNDRESITITVESVNAHTVGALIALYERAVGLYANLVGINAYHQPGVEAGKKAAAATLEIAKKVIIFLQKSPGNSFTVEQITEALGLDQQCELVFKLLDHMAMNTSKNIHKETQQPFYKSTYTYQS